MKLKAWCWRWWASTRSDWVIFSGLMNLTGVLLVQPVVLACCLVAFCFRVPSYLVNLIDMAGGFSERLELAVDWFAFRDRLIEVRDSARNLFKMWVW